MQVTFKYGKEDVVLNVPENSDMYASTFETENRDAEVLLPESVLNPVGCMPLKEELRKRRDGKVIIVVSDITRPIPYRSFLPALLALITNEGISKEEIEIIVATGMHRSSTQEEKEYMFGKDIAGTYTIIDHNAEDESMLSVLKEKSWSGSTVKLNRNYVESGFRILTGLVEPHFMAGFSGGRKSICPGLASLETIRMFHGYQFLSHPRATNVALEHNPCHLENSSIARICPADFSVNIILDQEKRINKIISGEQFLSHETAVAFLKGRSYKFAGSTVDLAVTSCGGYPLDDTFYQCVKGFVNCLPVLTGKGEIIAFGSCGEGIGSAEYASLMKKYAYKHEQFLNDIKNKNFFIKDQWQFQTHIRVLKRIGVENLHFYTTNMVQKELKQLSVTAHAVSSDRLANTIQKQIDKAVNQGKRIAVFPEGPYCSAVFRE